MNLTRIARSADTAVERSAGHDPLVHQAARQAQVLATAAVDSPALYPRTLLARLAREWARAAIDAVEALEEDEDAGPVIIPAAAVAPGALVWHPTGGESTCTLVRVMTRDGQVSLHLEDAGGRPVYVNLTVAGSPVVVLS